MKHVNAGNDLENVRFKGKFPNNFIKSTNLSVSVHQDLSFFFPLAQL
jgi:hypothetical protein